MTKRCLFPGCINAPLRRNICEPCLDRLNDFASPQMTFVDFINGCNRIVDEFAKAGGNTKLIGAGARW